MPFADVNGTRLHYHVTGEGIPLIFIHPPLLNSEVFNYQKAQLADVYKVITFDIRGHGHSSYSPQPVAYPLVVEDIKQLMDFLDVEEAILCGYSAGGQIVIEAMLTYPDRFIGGVLVSTMPEVQDVVLKSQLRLASLLSRPGGKRLLGGAISWGNADMNVTFNNLYKGAVNGDTRNIRQYFEASLQYRCVNRLREIAQPMLLVYGEKNRGFQRYARLLEERLPKATLRWIPEVSHQIPTKAPRAFHRLLQQWVEETFLGPAEQSRMEAFLEDVPADAFHQPEA